VAQQEPLFFMSIIPGIVKPTISAQATGYLGDGTNCMYALGAGGITGAPPASTATTTVNLNGCGVLSNGPITIPNCVVPASPTAAPYGFGALSIGYIGTSDPTSGCFNPNAQAIATQTGDPLISYQSKSPGAPGTCMGAPTTYIPGIFSYPCGLQFTSGTTTLTSGTYVIGNGLTINGTAHVTGAGVTFYIPSGQVLICATTAGSPVNLGTPCSAIGGSDVQLNLTAPTTGDFAGILFYQDLMDALPAYIVGNDAFGVGNTTLEGAFYFPTASLTLAEISNQINPATSYNAAVADSISLIGTVQFGDGSNFFKNVPDPIRAAVLVQ
jgi:hypothetical protein